MSCRKNVQTQPFGSAVPVNLPHMQSFLDEEAPHDQTPTISPSGGYVSLIARASLQCRRLRTAPDRTPPTRVFSVHRNDAAPRTGLLVAKDTRGADAKQTVVCWSRVQFRHGNGGRRSARNCKRGDGEQSFHCRHIGT